MNEKELSDAIAELIKIASTELPADVVNALRKARENEVEPARTQLSAILKNIELADNEKKPICQDTGTQTFFVKVGADFPYIGLIKKSI
ncbi:MAG: fumarate hydratase, partial [Thermoplasmata archaeon]